MNLQDVLKNEADFWNNIAKNRALDSKIPEQGDLRRATRVIAGKEIEPVDRVMTKMIVGKSINEIIRTISMKKNAKILDICCGPGWMSLELARNGHHVDAYDISKDAIDIAKRMLKENPFKENFGSINYHLADISQIELGEDTYDAITGMSAWHHLPDLEAFIIKAKKCLKPGGVIVTCDDVEQGLKESLLKRFFMLLLPVHGYTYSEKIKAIYRRIKENTISEVPKDVCSPMDELQHSNGTVGDIAKIWYNDFDVTYDKKYYIFALDVMRRLRGPSFIRYPIAYLLAQIDRLLCYTRLFTPYCRIIIGRNKL